MQFTYSYVSWFLDETIHFISQFHIFCSRWLDECNSSPRVVERSNKQEVCGRNKYYRCPQSNTRSCPQLDTRYQRKEPHRRTLAAVYGNDGCTTKFNQGWTLHLQAVCEMLPDLAASGHNLYARWARLYVQSTMQRQSTHPHVYRDFLSDLHVVRV